MGKTAGISVAVFTLLGIFWLAYMSDGFLKAPLELLRSLKSKDTPAGSSGLLQSLFAGTNDSPQPGANISKATAAKVDKIKRGMTRTEVEAILGVPAIVRNDVRDDGTPTQSAAWLHGRDRIYVEFLDGRVTMVVSAALHGLPVGQASTPEADGAKEAGQGQSDAGNRRTGSPVQDARAVLRQLEQRMKENDPDAVFEELRERPNQKK